MLLRPNDPGEDNHHYWQGNEIKLYDGGPSESVWGGCRSIAFGTEDQECMFLNRNVEGTGFVVDEGSAFVFYDLMCPLPLVEGNGVEMVEWR